MDDYLLVFPTEILVEIFSYAVERYSEFRCLSRATNSAKISWDEWDALIAQGWMVDIDHAFIHWSKGEITESPPFPRPLGEDIPAIEDLQAGLFWYKGGNLHRENDLPSLIDEKGDLIWHKNGERWRENGLPSIVRASGIKIWQQGEYVFNIEYPKN